MPGIPGIPAEAASAPPPVGPTALVQPPPAYVTPLWLATCAAAVHVGGTDSLPTSLAPDVSTVTPPRLGILTGGGGVTMLAYPGTLMPPPAASAATPTELISAKPLVTAPVMIAGLGYPADATPLTN